MLDREDCFQDIGLNILFGESYGFWRIFQRDLKGSTRQEVRAQKRELWIPASRVQSITLSTVRVRATGFNEEI